MAVTIGEAIVRLTGDSSGLSKGLESGKAQLDAAARRVGQSAGQQLGEATRKGLSGMLGGIVDTLGKIGLAGMGVAAVGTALKGAFAGPVMAASDLNEAVNKTDVVFGKAATSVHEFATGAAQALGMSRTEAEAYAGTFGNLLVSMGFGEQAAAGYSKSILTLASDMASFNNASPVDVLEAIRAGLVGESEPLRRYGVNLSAAAVEQEALSRGIKKSYNEMSTQEKATLAYAIILRQTKTAQGDFARTSTGMANALRIIKASFSDIKAEIGNRLLPVLAPLVSAFARSLPSALKVITPLLDGFGRVVARIGGGIGKFGTFFQTLTLYAREFGRLLTGRGDIGAFFDSLSDTLGVKVNGLQSAFTRLNRALAPFRQSLSGLFQLLRGNADGWADFTVGITRIFGGAVGSKVAAFVVNLRSLSTYLSGVAKAGTVFTRAFDTLPASLQPLARILGSVVLGLTDIGKAFLDLLAGESSFREFFTRVGRNVKVWGLDILKAFGDIGRQIWGYLFDEDDAAGRSRAGQFVRTLGDSLTSAARSVFGLARGGVVNLWGWLFGIDDATGRSRAGTFVGQVRTGLADKAREEFSSAKALGADLLAWVFGRPNEGANTQASAETFLSGHRGIIAGAARAVFGLKGAGLVNLAALLLGQPDAKGISEKVSEVLQTIRNWFSPENIRNALSAGGAIVKDVWAFLFGGEERVAGVAGSGGATVWADGVISRLVSALREAVERQSASVDIWGWLFGSRQVVIGAAGEPVEVESEGAVTSLLRRIDAWLLETANRIKSDPSFEANARQLGKDIMDTVLGIVAGVLDPERQKTGAESFSDLGAAWGKAFIQGFKDSIQGPSAKAALDAILSSLIDEQLKDPLLRGFWEVIFRQAFGNESVDARLRRLGLLGANERGTGVGGIPFAEDTIKGTKISAGSSPLAAQFASMLDPVALNTLELGQKIGDSITSGMVMGLAAGESRVRIAISGIFDARLAAAQVETMDMVTLALAPYRP